MPGYAIMKLRLRARIGDRDYPSILGVAVNNFAINQIPSATLMLPLGRNLDTDEIALIHETYPEIRTEQKVQVWLTATHGGVEGAIPGLPDGEELLVFEGKVIGVGRRQSENRQAQFTVSAIHWLADLDESSAISAASHPGNPAAYTFPAAFRALGSAQGDAAGGANTPFYTPGNLIVGPDDLVDLWKRVFLPRMQAVSREAPIDDALAPLVGPDVNAARVRALDRMTPQLDGMPLELDVANDAFDDISNGIQNALNGDQGGNWVHTTLWGKLVGEWAAGYFFSVVPRIEDALVVPFTGGLQGEQWATIGVDDYTTDELNGNMPRLLRAVGIIRPVLFNTGADLFPANAGRANTPNDRSGVGGLFVAPGVNNGVILLKDAPAWLADGLSASLFAGNATGVSVARGVIATALDPPGTGIVPGAPPNPGENEEHQRQMLDRLAQQWYAIEMLRGRTGEVGGKLRFDIAPGSNVMLEVAQARNVEAARNRLSNKLYATVMSVSYMIDAEQQRAWTGFGLAHLRNEIENRSPSTSVARPALYKNPWRGASLIRTILPEQPTQ